MKTTLSTQWQLRNQTMPNMHTMPNVQSDNAKCADNAICASHTMPFMHTMPIVHTMPFMESTQCQLCAQCQICSTFGIVRVHIWHCVAAYLALCDVILYMHRMRNAPNKMTNPIDSYTENNFLSFIEISEQNGYLCGSHSGPL